ncbi:Dabb family protein [Acerihabitans arboris]|uniref:Dabb family protein n=1 Tax=Acerihabitans arboris TaxID=2691583 RepID=A0A845SRL7_9GAMM|nr:Dabb family protein [Acerihabitans arboris]NDL65191.1 Dabb family protein [Acerihabitans arboris]
MIEHNVLFRFKSALDKAEIRRVANQLLAMDHYIPGIQAASWHDNASQEQRDKGFRYLLRLCFADSAALEHYLTHRHHLYVCENVLFPVLADGAGSVLVFDVEVNDHGATPPPP